MNARVILAAVCILCLGSCFFAAAQERKQDPKVVASSPDQATAAEAAESDGSASAAASPKPTPRNIEAAERIEGEKRFRTNCGRCHHPPEDLSPREARAVLRQMRVRAMLSAEDERLILKFLAP